ncbi:MAG: DUF3375 family protein [Planctomycetota bacterium]
MRLPDLVACFESGSADLTLFRSPNGPYLLYFFDREWKQANRVELSQSELEDALRQYKSFLREPYPGRLTASVSDDIADWVKHGWLQRRYVNAKSDEPIYQLSPATEDVLGYFGRLLDRSATFVGTGSRLHQAVELLEEVIESASTDPDVRLAALEKKRRAIEEEISDLEGDGVVAEVSAARIRERFRLAVSLLRGLQGDFRSVEKSFQTIARGVQSRQSAGEGTRGDVLGGALDDEDALKTSDEGQSFFAFVKMVLNPTQTDRLDEIVARVKSIKELDGLRDEIAIVERTRPNLANEAQSVWRTNQRLTSCLKRLLDRTTSDERRRAAELLAEIRSSLAGRADACGDGHAKWPPIGIDVPIGPRVDSPTRYRWWAPARVYESAALHRRDADPERARASLADYKAMARLDWTAMACTLEAVAALDADQTLRDLLEHHPPRAGAVEVAGYLQLAREHGHEVHDDAVETVVVVDTSEHGADDDFQIELTIPVVRLLPAGRRRPSS